jgi:dethiobiotin synthetase
MHLFVTAIGTDCGKTLVSAILTKALEATYWKPVQAGAPTDTQTIQALIPEAKILPELYNFTMPASPHFAGEAEGIKIDLHNFRIPPLETEHLVVEGAGGLMVPLNEKDFLIDIPQFLSLEVVLVVNLYLGCINHSLLAINEINRRNVRVKGIVFNGDLHNDSAEFIAHYSGWPILAHIPKLELINEAVIAQMALEISPALV